MNFVPDPTLLHPAYDTYMRGIAKSWLLAGHQLIDRLIIFSVRILTDEMCQPLCSVDRIHSLKTIHTLMQNQCRRNKDVA